MAKLPAEYSFSSPLKTRVNSPSVTISISCQPCGSASASYLSSLRDASGLVLIDGFYDDIVAPEPYSRELTSTAPFPLEDIQAETGGRRLLDGVNAANFYKHLNFEPCLNVNGFHGGSGGEGAKALGIWTSSTGRQCVAAGNLLANDGVPKAMIETFEATKGVLGDRLVAALKAAVEAGGEAGPVRSAGLLVVDRQSWPYAELRVDWLDEGCPIAAVAKAWEVYKPQAVDYVTRALNPLQPPHTECRATSSLNKRDR